MLCGIASWQIDDTKIACQGWDRIDQMLVPNALEKFSSPLASQNAGSDLIKNEPVKIAASHPAQI
jgi:hypothetical protein